MLKSSRGIIVIVCVVFLAMLPSISSAALAPTVTSISPDKAANFQATSVTITGSNFSPTPTGRLNNVWLENVTFVSSTMLTATVPGHLPAGSYWLTVINPDAQAASLLNALTVVASGDGSLSSWQITSSMVKGRACAATAISGDYLYAIGGYNGNDRIMSSVEWAKVNSDGTVGLWQLTSSMITPRCMHAAAAHNGYLYAVGGHTPDPPYSLNTVERSAINSDGSLGSWQTASPMLVARYGLDVVVWGHYLYAIGGTTGSMYHNTIERALINGDGSLGNWEIISSMNTPRSEFGAALAGDHIYVVGGWDGSYTASVEKAVINSDGTLGSWQPTSSLNTVRHLFGVALAAGTIYAIGGRDVPGYDLTSVEKATVDSDGFLGPWQLTSGLVTEREEFRAVAARGYIYAIGGSNRSGQLNTIERARVGIYTPTLDSFSPQAVPSSSSSEVIVSGTGFLPPTALRLGDTIPLTASFVSSTTLTATVPAFLPSGWYTATLTNPDGAASSLPNALVVDGDAPSGSIVVNSGQAFTNNRSVSLSISASDVGSGVAQMSFSNDGTAWAEWQGFAIAATWSLSTGDGTKTVYARFRDQAGNISATASDDIILDTLGPSASMMPLSTYQATLAFPVTWSGSDSPSGVSRYDVQRRDGATGMWADWQVAVVHTTSDFTGQDGHTYYFRVRAWDNLGNAGPFSSSNTQTTVDVTPPTGSITILSGGGANEQSTSVVLGLTAIDAVSGVGSMMLSNDPSFAGANWESFATTRTWTLGSGNTVYARFRDNAGNVSQTYSAEWRLMLPLLVR